MSENEEPSKKYYTEENPGGPWSRALYQMRTGKSFSEEELKKDLDNQNKLRELLDEDHDSE